MTEISIIARENGPYIIMVNGKDRAYLCRCGGSQRKPYCDGTHAKIGFKAEASEIRILEE